MGTERAKMVFSWDTIDNQKLGFQQLHQEKWGFMCSKLGFKAKHGV
jgi:hypothetical protein